MKAAIAAICVALSINAFQAVHSADYQLSEEFDLETSITAAPEAYLPLGDGRAIAFGNFDQLNGELTGSFLILDTDKSFKPLTSEAPILGSTPSQAVLNSNGTISVLFEQHSISAIDSASAALLTYNANGELDRAIGIPYGLLLLPDDQFAVFENQRNDITTPPTWTTKAIRYTLESSNVLTPDTTFTSPSIPGTTESIHTLPGGGFLLQGEFPHASTLATSLFIKLTSSGAIDTSFSRTGITKSTPNLELPQPIALPNGDIFLVSSHGYSPTLIRLASDGTIDSAFTLAPDIGFYPPTTTLTPTESGQYYLSGNSLQIDQDHVNALRLNADGSLDETFQFDRTKHFVESGWGHSAFVFTDGTVLTSGRTSEDDYQNIHFAQLSADGTATAIAPGLIEQLTKATASWLPSGELLLEDGIAHVDGSRRVSFSSDIIYHYLRARPTGGFVGPNYEIYDENVTLVNTLEPPQYTNFLAVLPDDTLLVYGRVEDFGDQVLRKLRLDGTFDPDFPQIPAPYEILAVTDTHFYFAAYDDAVGDQTLQRYSIDGTRDTSFSIQNDHLRSSQITITDEAIYLPYVRPLGQAPQQIFGARYLLDGSEDTSYTPHNLIRRTSPSELPTKLNFAPDGSSFHLALADQQEEQGGFANLYRISPLGEVTVIDGSLRWKNATVSVSAEGDVLVSGTAKTPIGEVETAGLYTSTPVSFSTPFLEKVSYSSEAFTLEVATLEEADASYSWLKNGAPLSGETSTTLSFPSLGPDDAGDYTLTATSNGETHKFGPIKLLPPSHPVISQNPQDLFAYLNSNQVLQGHATALPNADYQWFRDGKPLAGANSPSLEIESLSLGDIGTYQLRARNPFGTNWSKPAIVSLKGVAKVGETRVKVRHEVSSPAALNGNIIPRKGGGYFDRRTDPNDPFAIKQLYTEHKPDGTVVEDYASTLNLGDYDDIRICPFSGQIFPYWSEYIDNGTSLRTTFTRLRPNGSIDSDFGEHSIEGDYFRGAAFRQWPDGTVWVESYHHALSITSEGVATEIKRNRGNSTLYNTNFIDKFSLALDDGTVTLVEQHGAPVYRISAEGDLVEEHHTLQIGWREDGLELMGIWPNGTMLFYDDANAMLRSLDWAEAEQWTIPLGDRRILTIHNWEQLAASTVGQDSTQIHLIVHQDDTYASAQIVTVSQDGTHNLDTSKTFDVEFKAKSFTALENDEFLITGRGANRNKFSEHISGTQTVNPTTGEIKVSTLSIQTNRQVTYLSDTTPDGSFFAILDGSIIDDIETGFVAKFGPDRKPDPNFVPDIDWSVVGWPEKLLPLPDGGVAVITHTHGRHFCLVLRANGEARSSFEIIPTTLTDIHTSPPAIHLQNNSHLITLSSNLYETELQRHTLDGVKDTQFSPDTSFNQISYLDSDVDSQGRIYFAFDPVLPGPNLLVRYHADGSIDNSFSRPSEIEDIKAIAIDSQNRLYVGGSSVHRLTNSGMIDPNFEPRPLNLSFHSFFTVLPNDSLVAGYSIYDKNGLLQERLGSFGSTYRHHVVGGALAIIPHDYQPDSVNLEFYSLTGFPAIYRQPRSQSASLGSSHTLQIHSEPVPGIRYQWFRNGKLIEGENSASLAFPSLQPSDFANYSVTMKWPNGELAFPQFSLSQGTGNAPAASLPELVFTNDGTTLNLHWEDTPETPFTLMQSDDHRLWLPAAYPLARDGNSTQTSISLESAELPIFLKLEHTE
ncbi:immunoglobulin domain-containing protein [Pelagicoccus mobilis]|uniref:Ig-like domain-containing protein n=1 Tax=Pelagicoccus mobilis TaxID=415221 RepID=A0A934VPN3_9BACT|nr:immunoglobulin domain-containing protein [Pelagicoccus mobilis]MBK1875708.1 hypothetical protein [Pelagicoccus mobilis]